MKKSHYLLGIDLGGSSIKAAAVTPDGQVILQRTEPFAVEQASAWGAKIKELVETFRFQLGGPAASLGLSAPGLVARDARSIAFMPGRLSGLEGLDWTRFLERSEPVLVLNDAHAALLGEAWLGAAAGLNNVFMLTLGTGVGGAAMVDGNLLRGHIGRAGHLGHICLHLDGPPDITRTPGSLEWLVGNCSIAERSRGRFTSTHALLEACRAGDSEASRIWMRSVHALACAVASLINVLDPEMVIIGGGIARAGAALFEPLAERLESIEWRPGGHNVPLRPAALGEFAGAIGAAGRARLSPSGTVR